MVQALFNNKRSDFGPGLSIPFAWLNAMFQDKKINQDYTYSFTLPFTAVNKKLFKYMNRFDTEMISEYDFKLVVAGSVIIEGLAKVTGSGDGDFSVTVVSYGVDFAQRIAQKLMKDVPMDEITVALEADSGATRISKWTAHYDQVMKVDDPTTGSHKFPMINTAGYQGDFGYDNRPHGLNGGVVNPIAEGDFLPNWAVPDAQKPSNNPNASYWPFTIGPCPRVRYLFEKVFEYLGITTVDGAIWDDPEFLQMIVFAGVVLDDDRRSGTSTLNSYGLGFKIQDVVPDSTIELLFQLLNETYGCMYYFGKSSVRIRTYKEILSRRPVNFSRWCDDNQGKQVEDVLPPYIYYQTQEENKKPLFIPNYSFPIADVSGFQLDQSQRPIQSQSPELSREFPISHFPMKSSFFITEGMWHDLITYTTGTDTDKKGFGEYAPHFFFPYGIQSNGDPDGKYRQTIFNVGYYRGVHGTQRVHPNEDETAIVIDDYDTCWPYSWYKTIWDTRDTFTGFEHFFGSSLYLAEYKGTYDLWLKYYYDLFANYYTVIRELVIPAHVLVRMRDFEDIKHVLEDRRGSVIGYLEKIEGTITASGVGKVSFTYRVPNRVLSKADFNRDFSEDFHT